MQKVIVRHGLVDTQKNEQKHLRRAFDCNQFNFMRMSILGSQVSSSKKEMSSGQNHQQQKYQPFLKQETLSLDYRTSLNPWCILYDSKKILLSSLELQARLPLATISRIHLPSEQNEPEFSEDKKKEALSMINYLQGYLKVLGGQYQSSMSSILFLMLKLFNVEENSITETIWTNYQLQNKKIDIQYLTNINRNKLIICFSSKWRTPQTTIYILVHKFAVNSQDTIINGFILNQKGLILQAITNLREKLFWDQVSKIVKRHYKKLKNVIIIAEKDSFICLDDFQKLQQKFQNTPVIMVNALICTPRRCFTSEENFFMYQNDLIEGTYVSILSDKQIIVWSNTKFSQQLRQRISLLSQITKNQKLVASLFKTWNYKSRDFWQRQVLVRLYVFYFNFVTLNSMEASSQEELVKIVMENELNAMKIRENDQVEKSQTLKSHTYGRHQTPLSCAVCKAKTKIKCQKCCFEFNRYFGICEKTCFGLFHSDIPTYIHQVNKSKQVVNQNFQQSQDEEISQLSQAFINGRKKVKMNEESQESSMKSGSLASDENVKEEWLRQLENKEEQQKKFKTYCQLGLLPEMIMKKMQHMETKIQELIAKNMTNSLTQIKQIEPK